MAVQEKTVNDSFKLLIHANYCPYWMPWFVCPKELRKLQKLALLRGREFHKKNGRGWANIVITLLWPLISLAQASRNILREEAKYLAGLDNSPGIVSQFLQQLVLANRYNIGPNRYYLYRLWNRNNYNRASQYMIDPPFSGLLEILRNDADASDIYDKTKFFMRCRNEELPIAPLLAIVHKNKSIDWLGQPTDLPDSDVFIKPVDGSNGRGVECWVYGDNKWSRNDLCFSQDQLLKHIQDLATDSDYILMPRIVNHPDMMAFTSGALATLRIVTCHTPGKPVIIILSVLRMPMDSPEVDNFAAGGIAASINENGKLGAALAIDIKLGTFTRHPKTGREIEGATIPYYREACELCTKAHQAFSEIATIGWDIAITNDGPIFIEANSNPNTRLSQVATDTPLGETAFVEWATTHLIWLSQSRVQSGKIDPIPNVS